jgi:hypothetical protein
MRRVEIFHKEAGNLAPRAKVVLTPVAILPNAKHRLQVSGRAPSVSSPSEGAILHPTNTPPRNR